jgi:hypothetical protein
MRLDDVLEAWLRDLAANVLTAALLTTAVEPHLRRPGGSDREHQFDRGAPWWR